MAAPGTPAASGRAPPAASPPCTPQYKHPQIAQLVHRIHTLGSSTLQRHKLLLKRCRLGHIAGGLGFMRLARSCTPDQVDLGLGAGAAHGDGEYVVICKVPQPQRAQAGRRQPQRHVHCVAAAGVHAAPCAQVDACGKCFSVLRLLRELLTSGCNSLAGCTGTQ